MCRGRLAARVEELSDAQLLERWRAVEGAAGEALIRRTYLSDALRYEGPLQIDALLRPEIKAGRHGCAMVAGVALARCRAIGRNFD